MHEMGIGRAANVALCTLPGCSFPGDVSGSDKYYADDIVNPPILATRGSIAAPDRPGLGWMPDEARITAATERTSTFKVER
jgi:O-succinylbenzoate synthase